VIEILIGVFVTAFVSVIITYGLAKSYKHRFTKYIPIILAVILGTKSIIDICSGSEGFKKVSYVISTIIWVEIFLTMLITALIIDIKKNTNNS
jgi:hypothetical protein